MNNYIIIFIIYLVFGNSRNNNKKKTCKQINKRLLVEWNSDNTFNINRKTTNWHLALWKQTITIEDPSQINYRRIKPANFLIMNVLPARENMSDFHLWPSCIMCIEYVFWRYNNIICIVSVVQKHKILVTAVPHII